MVKELEASKIIHVEGASVLKAYLDWVGRNCDPCSYNELLLVQACLKQTSVVTTAGVS